MWDVPACRCCLNTKCRLFKINDINMRLFKNITNLEMKPGDGLPFYFCAECNTVMKKIFAFRRKCRRAYFVMKEIMLTQKQVSLNDLVFVDRKKDNLVSSCDYWAMKNAGFYATDETEEDFAIEEKPIKTEPAEPKEITKYIPKINNKTCIITDIKPANYKQIEEEEERMRILLEEKQALEESQQMYEDAYQDDDIDLDDVFKGMEFEETVERAESVVDDGFPVQERKRRYRAKYQGSKKTNAEVKALCDVVFGCDIRALSADERLASYSRRLLLEPYHSSLFKCAVCLITFADMQELVDHANQHNQQIGPDMIMCDICKCRLKSKADLQAHTSSLHSYEFTCLTCGATRYTFPEMKSHIETHQKIKEDVDDDIAKKLNKQFKIRNLSPTEAYTRYDRAKRLECNYCEYKANKKAAMDHHKALHFSPSPVYTCDICGSLYGAKKFLTRHITLNHMHLYKCTTCGKEFTCRLLAIRHLSRKHESEEDKTECKPPEPDKGTLRSAWHCTVCGLAARARDALLAHQFRRHDMFSLMHPLIGDPACKCHHCDLQFLDQRALQTHQLQVGHPEAADIELACKSCKLLFDTETELVDHVSTCTSYYPRKCRLCDTVLKNGYQGRIHYRHRHTMLYKKLCELCGEVLNPQKYKVHMLKHEGEIHHIQCPYCPEKMTNNSAYIVHVLLHHTEKPYECNMCNIKYVYRRHCMDHILKRHAPEMPFSCDFCARRFAHCDYLVEHCKRHHTADVRKTLQDKARVANNKMAGKLIVYPHMRVDLSHIDQKYLDGLELYLSDYKSETLTRVEDYVNYIILDSTNPPIISRNKPGTTQKKINKVKNEIREEEGEDKVEKKKDKIPKKKRKLVNGEEKVYHKNFVNRGVNIRLDILPDALEHKIEYTDTDIEYEQETELTIKETDVEKAECDSATKYLEQIDDIHTTQAKVEYEELVMPEDQISFVGENGEKYDIIEEDGEQFVLINGELYKVAIDE